MSTTKPRTRAHENQAAAWAAKGDFRPTRHSHGPAAQDETRALLEAAGIDTIGVEERVGRGRPRLDPEGTQRWNIRTTHQLATQAKARADHEGRTVAELVRTAVSEYLEAHPA